MIKKLFLYLFLPIIIASVAFLAALAYSDNLPLLDNVPTAHAVLDRDGRLLRLGLSEDQKYRVRIPLESVSEQACEALLLYEDRYFYKHFGINPAAMLRAALGYLTGGRRTGASTITMQVARLRFNLPTGTWSGKLRQIWLALRLEKQYSKHDILEAYFNLAPYGGNIEGIEAASRIYFHKAASALTFQEAIALTIIPQNPIKRHPLHGKDFKRARKILSDIWQEKHKEDMKIASADSPLRIFSIADLPFEAPHVTAELLASQSQSIIKSSIAMREQKIIEKHISLFVARSKIYGLNNASAMLVYAPTREIRALVGSADFFNVDIQGQVDGTKAKRSPGSTLKPFIYALALDQGLIHPMSLLIDSPRSWSGYDPENFDKVFRGPLSARDALATSRNLPAIALAQQLKDPDLYSFLQNSGTILPKPRDHYGLSLVLGGAETTMRELATMYAILVNDGLYAPLSLIANSANQNINRRLLSREAAFITLDMLRRPDTCILKKGQEISISLKTGTSNGFRDAWTAGIIGDYILIVWVGNFDNKPNNLLTGAQTAQPLFMEIARSLSEKLPLKNKQPNDDLNLVSIPVCAATGDVDISLCQSHVQTWFIPGISPSRNSGVYQKILIDKKSGLRACNADPETTEYIVKEFWPGNLRQIFAQAGIYKEQIPDWMPECRPNNPDIAGKAPIIMSPKPGVIYHMQLSATNESKIPLTAGISAGGKRLYWFANDKLIGESLPDDILIWSPNPGKYVLKCADDLGRVSSRKVEVRATR